MMSTSIRELCSFLESIAPLSLQESYDNAGLITGNPDWTISGALVSLDATEEIVEEAIRLGSNVVISHHPIVFRGLKSITGQHYVERAIIKAIKNDIALYAIHTNLDNVYQNGVNQKIADKLGLKNHKLLLPKSDGIGSGLIGDLESALSLTECIAYIKHKMELKHIRHTRDLGKPIRKIAICGGSGAFLIPAAIASSVDAYITADIKYHEFFEANDQLTLFDIGHFESEQFTIELLFKLISEKYSNFASHCTKIYTNPVQYG